MMEGKTKRLGDTAACRELSFDYEDEYILAMLNYRNTVRGAIVLIIVLINFNMAPALAATESFQLYSDKGYRLETDFTYDQTEAKAIAKSRAANTLDFLQVRFYNPNNKMMASYDNIVDGKVQGEYFDFNYDLAAHRLSGEIDLGGESAGEIYLQGNIERGYTLIEVKPTGEEVAIDTGRWRVGG